MTIKQFLLILTAFIGILAGKYLAYCNNLDTCTEILHKANLKIEKSIKERTMKNSNNNINMIINRRNMRRNRVLLSKLSS